MSIRTLRVGASQLFTCLEVESNLSKMKEHLHQASQQGVEILLFPECCLSGYAPSNRKGNGFPYDWNRLRTAAEEFHHEVAGAGVACVYGTAWKDEEEWVNRAFVVDSDGEVVGAVDKVHLLGPDHDYFKPAKRLNPVEVLGIRLGIAICFDVRFPEVWRKLAREGAEILMNPLAAYGGATWKRPVMSAHSCSRAAENQRFFVSANSGPEQMAVSEIYDPAGIRLAAAEAEKEQILWADLRLGEFEEKGRRHLPNFLECLREDF